METLHSLLWTSAACLLFCMALDGTLADACHVVRALLRFICVRALAVLLLALAMMFRVGANRMENGCALSRLVWGSFTRSFYRRFYRPLARVVADALGAEVK